MEKNGRQVFLVQKHVIFLLEMEKCPVKGAGGPRLMENISFFSIVVSPPYNQDQNL